MKAETLSSWTISTRNVGIKSYLKELWFYRGLFAFFCQKSLHRLYRRTILGKFWIFVRPMVAVVSYTIFFHNVVHVETKNIPFLLFMIMGFTVWHTFERALTWSTRSLSSGRGIMQKVYFPRMLLPMAAQIVSVIECGFFLCYIVAAVIYFQYYRDEYVFVVSSDLLAAPLILIITLLFAFGISLFTSVLDALGRDMRFTLRYILQGWLFCTPILYPLSNVPIKWRWLFEINPLTSLVINFRSAFLVSEQVNWHDLIYPLIVAVISIIIGAWFFLTFENKSADSI